jgi:hypothetical protein
METFGTLLTGTVASPLVDLLLDLWAALTTLGWVVTSMLLTMHSGSPMVPEPPPAAARSSRLGALAEPEGEETNSMDWAA